MMNGFFFKTHLIIVLAFLVFALPIRSQDKKSEWQRIVTGEGFNIDVDKNSLVLLPDNCLSAKFKTTLSKAESIAIKSPTKYKTRLEIIRFNTKNGEYLVSETTLLDPSGKIAASYSGDPATDWKTIRKGTGSSLYYATIQLYPFGKYKVLAYKYADGGPKEKDEPQELQSLLGCSIYLSWDRIKLGPSTCSAPSFEHKSLNNEEFLSKTGNTIKSFGIESDKVEILSIQCTSEKNTSAFSVFFSIRDSQFLMLWDSVFLTLEREDDSSTLLKLITN